MSATIPVVGDTAKAVAFLEILRESGPWELSAVFPNDRTSFETKTFNDLTAAGVWIEKRNINRNVYVGVNPAIKSQDSKSPKTNIRGALWCHVDCDPRQGEDFQAERSRILTALGSYNPPPSIIVDSGGGYWGLWRLDKEFRTDGDKAKAEEEFELYNLKIELTLNADSCHNIDRIMRLPGTINWPDDNKKKKGQVPALAQVVVERPELIYALDQELTAAAKSGGGGGHGGGGGGIGTGPLPKVDLDDLPAGVSQRIKAICVQGTDPDKPHKSRSHAVFAVACAMVKAGVADDTIAAVLLDADFGISAHNREQPKPHRYVERQIRRAKEEAISPHLREMNDLHAVIENYGKKTRVMTEGSPPFFQAFDDFRNIYMNKVVQDGKNQVPLGKWWLTHPQRRQYRQVEFLPGGETPANVHNLWRGFPVVPIKGACDLFLAFVQDTICGGVEAYGDWLLDWMAHSIQRPQEPGEVAIVLRGGQGIGKSFYAEHFGELFGGHFIPVTDPKHVVGNFDVMLHNALFVFSDEAFAANDKRAEGVLKGLVTQKHITIEPKGVDAFKAPKFLRLALASNRGWVVPADMDDRRFFVLDVSELHKRDTAYFEAIDREWKRGGREALMHFLLNRDITRFDHRLRPNTTALVDQKICSLRGAAKIVYEMLASGEPPVAKTEGDAHECVFVATRALREDTGDRVSEFALGRELGIITDNPRQTAKREQCGDERKKGFWLPPLDEARRRWAKAHQLADLQWPKDDGEWITSDNEARGDDDGDPPF